MIADRTDAMISVGGFTEMGAVTGHRTAGIRGRILSRLRAAGEITDPGGLASAALAKAVDYPGSSAAFAQLLSGMERDGLIKREIRGKRTYRIGLVEPGLEMASARGEQEFEPGTSAAAAFDYDELAMRLLAQVVWRIAAPPDDVSSPDEALPVARALPGGGPEPRGEDLTVALASLDWILASFRSRLARARVRSSPRGSGPPPGSARATGSASSGEETSSGGAAIRHTTCASSRMANSS